MGENTAAETTAPELPLNRRSRGRGGAALAPSYAPGSPLLDAERHVRQAREAVARLGMLGGRLAPAELGVLLAGARKLVGEVAALLDWEVTPAPPPGSGDTGAGITDQVQPPDPARDHAEALRLAGEQWAVVPLAEVLERKSASLYAMAAEVNKEAPVATLGDLARELMRGGYLLPQDDLAKVRRWWRKHAPGPLRDALPPWLTGEGER